jgi:hypothetical protein
MAGWFSETANCKGDNMNEEPKVIYIAIGPNVWGKGFTEDQARDACKAENGNRVPKETLVYTSTDPWAYIDEMGSIVHKQGSVYTLLARYKMRKRTAVTS